MDDVGYPLFEDKWQDETFHGAPQFIEGAKALGWDPGHVPKGVVFAFDHRLRQRLDERPDAHEAPELAPGNARVYRVGEVVVSCLSPGGGAMATQMENLIYLGVRRFLIVGTCGSINPELRPGDTVVADSALRDDGISQHYLPPGRYVDGSPEIADSLHALLPRARRGATWTMPIPYRITKRELDAYAAENVLSVEMEVAALFAVAQARDAEAGAVLVATGVTTTRERIEDWPASTEPLGLALEATLTIAGD
ncbi:MAG: nucleoside phosphorylase [Gaiellaceae bacterium MAG52_C11]|nr:nucleoside phosphorylase [Candidatus Gaiellasilicea maunaloa]